MLNNLFYGLQHGRRRMSLFGNIAVAFFILFLLYTFTKNESAKSYTHHVIQNLYGDDPTPAPTSKYDLFTLETIDLSHLAKHQLSENFFYSRRTINTRYVAGERKTLTNYDQALFKQSSKVPNKNLESFTRRQDLPLSLDVSVPSPVTGAKTLSFGIATPIQRLLDSLPQLMHWLPNTGAMLHVISPADPRVKNVTEHIRNLGINITIVESYDRFPINYFSLLPLLYHTRLPGTKWLALIDDDTFFPDLGNLLEHLEERYNPKLPQVISGVSDDIVQIRKHGLMPFGGGGIFVSVPFAAMICDNNYPGTAGSLQGETFPTPPNPDYSPFGPPMEDAETATGAPAPNYILDPQSPYRHSAALKNCLATTKFEGDQIFNDCINQQTKVRPQYDIGFHQMDLKGDISGFFESGRRSLTVHHWKTWFKVDIPSVAAVTKICGKDCFLQRFRFKGLDAQGNHPDETWVLNNGYSITKYPNGIKGLAKDLPEPPEPPAQPPPSGLPDPRKDPITANPRFLRPKTGTWTEWPDLGLGEEVVYEGVMGVIIDKSMAKGSLTADKKTDPYKGFGNLEWVPMNPPFVKEEPSLPADEKPKDAPGELKKDEAEVVTAAVGEKKESDVKSAETENKDASSKDESKDTSNKDTANIQPVTAANAKDEISHFQRLRRSLSEIPRKLTNRDEEAPKPDWLPISDAEITSGTVISDVPTEVNTSAPSTSSAQVPDAEREKLEEEFDDERRFWEGIEKTWGGQAPRFEHALGPLRRQLKRDEEVVRFLMVESVGGWGDPGKQDTENVKATLIPEKFVKGFPGDPEKKKAEVKHGGDLMGNGDPGFDSLWGPDPVKPPPEPPKEDSPPPPKAEEEKHDPVPKRAVGGGSIIAARSEKSSFKSFLADRAWGFGGGSKKPKTQSPTTGGIGGIDRPPADWVRQTYIRKRWNPPGSKDVVPGDGDGDGKGEDEVIELIWIK